MRIRILRTLLSERSTPLPVSAFEKQVLIEKTKGLSDLEVTYRLMHGESTVRSIARKHPKGLLI